MGIYTNNSSFVSTDYRSVEPFVGEHFNYHELGIIAASEVAANHNAFMKAIALNELAAFEQTGSTDVLYESVNIKDIFNKIKEFIKKIIDKIHKIFNTFMAKMASLFGDTKTFAKKYEKEIKDGWKKIKDNFTFKGYNYNKAITCNTNSDTIKVNCTDKNLQDLVNGKLSDFVKDSTTNPLDDNAITNLRKNSDDIKESINKQIVDNINGTNAKIDIADFDINPSSPGAGLNQTDYTKELFKAFRGGEEEKEDLTKSKIETCYGSIDGLVKFLEDFGDTKKNLIQSDKNITRAFGKLSEQIDIEKDKLENRTAELRKSNTGNYNNNIAANERVIQAAGIYQNIYGGISESIIQAFGALLQANKEACSQAKAIAVKVIGQSKKDTVDESYNYDSDSNNGFSFIESVKLI